MIIVFLHFVVLPFLQIYYKNIVTELTILRRDYMLLIIVQKKLFQWLIITSHDPKRLLDITLCLTLKQ